MIIFGWFKDGFSPFFLVGPGLNFLALNEVLVIPRCDRHLHPWNMLGGLPESEKCDVACSFFSWRAHDDATAICAGTPDVICRVDWVKLPDSHGLPRSCHMTKAILDQATRKEKPRARRG